MCEILIDCSGSVWFATVFSGDGNPMHVTGAYCDPGEAEYAARRWVRRHEEELR